MKKQLTIADQIALATMAKQNWGSWMMPDLGIGYTAIQQEDGEQTATIVTFDHEIVTPDGFTGRRIRVYPISKNKPEGKLSTIRR